MQVEYVAIAVLINESNQVLIAKRCADKYMGNKWEFPGGKVEDGESSPEALYREMKEELGIEVQSTEFLTDIIHKYDDKKVILDVYIVKKWLGKAKGMEQQPLRWVEKSELKKYDFPAANSDILALL